MHHSAVEGDTNAEALELGPLTLLDASFPDLVRKLSRPATVMEDMLPIHGFAWRNRPARALITAKLQQLQDAYYKVLR